MKPDTKASRSRKAGSASSLVDTVRVVVPLRHAELSQLDSAHIRRDGAKTNVRGPFDTFANIYSLHDRTALSIEASIPKFLTGQNVVGLEDLHGGCQELILEVATRAGLQLPSGFARRINAGRYRVTRIDFTAHCKLRSDAQANAVMRAVRALAITAAKDCAFYSYDTVMIGQRSSRRTDKFYRKDHELQKHPISARVRGHAVLTAFAQGAVRVEVTKRGQELVRLGLHDPLAWTPSIGRAWIHEAVRKMNVEGVVLDEHMDLSSLSRSSADRFRAWQLGDASAFARYPGRAEAQRREILLKVGVDVLNPLGADVQRASARCVRELLLGGIRFGDVSAQWSKLRGGADDSIQAGSVY